VSIPGGANPAQSGRRLLWLKTFAPWLLCVFALKPFPISHPWAARSQSNLKLACRILDGKEAGRGRDKKTKLDSCSFFGDLPGASFRSQDLDLGFDYIRVPAKASACNKLIMRRNECKKSRGNCIFNEPAVV
jgi:hypothetical protein